MPKKLGFKDFVSQEEPTEGEEVELQAALNIQQRLKKARQMKKLAPKIAMGRARAARKVANMETLKKRAQKQARNMIAKKLTKGISKADLNMARRMEIEKRLDKMKPKIDKLAKKLLPKVRKSEMARKRGKSEKS